MIWLLSYFDLLSDDSRMLKWGPGAAGVPPQGCVASAADPWPFDGDPVGPMGPTLDRVDVAAQQWRHHLDHNRAPIAEVLDLTRRSEGGVSVGGRRGLGRQAEAEEQ